MDGAGASDQPRPGWYADPTDGTQHRWWSGTAWTEQTRPAGTAGAAGATDATATASGGGTQRWSLGTKLALVAGALVLVAGSAATTMWVMGEADSDTALATQQDRSGAQEPAPGDVAGSEPDGASAFDDDDLEPDPEVGDEPLDAPVDAPDDPVAEPDDTMTEAQDPPDTEEPADRSEDLALTETDLVATVAAYIDALDAGDIRAAHALLAPSLQQQPGWSLDTFVDFWDGYLEGAFIVEYGAVVPRIGQVDAVVRYLLADDGLSEEEITFRLARADSGAVLIEDYTVEHAERIR